MRSAGIRASRGASRSLVGTDRAQSQRDVGELYILPVEQSDAQVHVEIRSAAEAGGQNDRACAGRLAGKKPSPGRGRPAPPPCPCGIRRLARTGGRAAPVQIDCSGIILSNSVTCAVLSGSLVNGKGDLLLRRPAGSADPRLLAPFARKLGAPLSDALQAPRAAGRDRPR